MKKEQPSSPYPFLFLFGLAVLYIALGILLGALYLLFQVAVATLPAWAVTVALLYLFKYNLGSRRVDSLIQDPGLADAIAVRVEGDQIRFYACEQGVQAHADTVQPMAFAVIASLLWCALYLGAMHSGGGLSRFVWWFWGTKSAASPAAVISVYSVIVAASVAVPVSFPTAGTIFKNRLWRELEQREHALNAAVLNLRELALRNICNSLTGRSQCPVAAVNRFIADHKNELIRNDGATIDELNNLIAEQLKAAHETRDDGAARPSQPGRMTAAEAREILGVGASAGKADIRKAYVQAVGKWNVDHRQELEPHIRALVEENFKKVNLAYEVLTK